MLGVGLTVIPCAYTHNRFKIFFVCVHVLSNNNYKRKKETKIINIKSKRQESNGKKSKINKNQLNKKCYILRVS